MDTGRKKRNGAVKDLDTDLILKKHVGLIHCENKLTLIQRKICNILLFNALDKIHDQDIFEISVRKLSNLVGYNSNDSKQIKDSIKTLIATVMEWNLLDDRKFLKEEEYPEEAITWNASSLLAGASIKNGVIQYSYSPQMRSVLFSLGVYGQINLFVQSKFNSTYSLVLYENCVRFKNIKKTSWFSIDLFRSLMGVPKDKYALFKDFNRKVITVAVDEINQKSDIYIEANFRRVARKITAIQFTIHENENYKPSFKKIERSNENPSPIISDQSSDLFEIMVSDFQLSKKQVESVLAEYDASYVSEKINLVKSKKRVKHRGAYLLAALKQDYKPNARVPKNVKTSTAKTPHFREAKKAIEIEPLRNKYLSYKLKTYTDFIKKQDESLQCSIKEEFEQRLKPNVQIFQRYKKSGYVSPFVITTFLTFIEERFSHVLGSFLSFDDYITSDEI